MELIGAFINVTVLGENSDDYLDELKLLLSYYYLTFERRTVHVIGFTFISLGYYAKIKNNKLPFFLKYLLVLMFYDLI